MSQLFEKIVSGKAGDEVATKDMLGTLSRQQFNQRLPRLLPAGLRVAHKTGTVTGPVCVVNDAGIIYLPKVALLRTRTHPPHYISRAGHTWAWTICHLAPNFSRT